MMALSQENRSHLTVVIETKSETMAMAFNTFHTPNQFKILPHSFLILLFFFQFSSIEFQCEERGYTRILMWICLIEEINVFNQFLEKNWMRKQMDWEDEVGTHENIQRTRNFNKNFQPEQIVPLWMSQVKLLLIPYVYCCIFETMYLLSPYDGYNMLTQISTIQYHSIVHS